PLICTLLPYTTLFRSFQSLESRRQNFSELPWIHTGLLAKLHGNIRRPVTVLARLWSFDSGSFGDRLSRQLDLTGFYCGMQCMGRSEEHTSELQSRFDL